MQPERLPWIQALRAVAALLVLLFHLVPYWQTAWLLAPFTAAFRWGFTGVDVFFALSGFVVCRGARQAALQRRVGAFAVHRLVRIYAGYWPALAFFALVAATITHRPWPEPAALLASITLLQANPMAHWLVPAWSLTLELTFYAWIVLLVVLRPHDPVRGLALALLALVVWNAAWVVGSPGTIASGAQPLRYQLTVFGVEFLAGALLAEAHARLRHAAIEPVTVAAAAGAVVVLCGVLGGWTNHNVEFFRVATFGLMAVALLVFTLALQADGSRAPAWLVQLGDASYSLYLLHVPLIEALYAIGLQLFAQGVLRGEAAKTIYLAAMLPVIVLVALAWYRGVERPVLRWALRLVSATAGAVRARAPRPGSKWPARMQWFR